MVAGPPGSYQHGIKVGGGTSSDFFSAALPAADLTKYSDTVAKAHGADFLNYGAPVYVPIAAHEALARTTATVMGGLLIQNAEFAICVTAFVRLLLP